MLVIDALLFVVPALALQYVVAVLPPDLSALLAPLVLQTVICLPMFTTLAIIVSGLMFELGQGTAISSSEAVNWLPVTPREYVAASSLSTSWLYSFYLALAAGITLPLAVGLGLFHLWPMTMLLSLLSLLLGAFIVEILKAIMNRVSSSVYRKRGRLALAMRLIALILLFAIVQLAFQPYFLYWALGQIVGGVEIAWAVPFVWSSVALISLASYDLSRAVFFALFSSLFTVAAYEVASQLRRRYWSPVPVSISLDGSGEYLPRGSMGIGFGFNPLASVLAMKEFRALLRRKDLARFMAIPIVVAVSFLLPTLLSPSDMSGRGPGFFLAAFIPFMVPFMFSSITIGQEGNSIANLLSLPITPTDLIKGKLAPAWLISGLAVCGVIASLEALAPMGLSNALATLAVALMVIVVNSFIGLGVGTRWPDYTVGARSRYVTMKGFLIGFVLSGLATVAVFAPVGLHIVTSGGVRGQVPFADVGLLPMLVASTVLGGALTVLSYRFCRKGVESLLSDM